MDTFNEAIIDPSINQFLFCLKKYIILSALSILYVCSYANSTDSLLIKLDEVISKKQYYTALKDKRINAYQLSLMQAKSKEEVYDINGKLYEEYRKFKIDSSLYYVEKNLEIARLLKNPAFENKAKIQQAYLFSSAGRYLEADHIFKSIRTADLSRELKELYYEFFYRLMEHYTSNNPTKFYSDQIEVYRDSLLTVLDPTTDKYKINLAQHFIYTKDFKKAEELLAIVLAGPELDQSNYAMANYLVGDIHNLNGQKENAVDFYTIAAITDVENAINDHGAIQNLAIYFYNTGQIDRAYRYAKSALEDAIFCNVKFRTLMMSEFFAIVNAAYQKKTEISRKQLESNLLLISLLAIFLIIAIIFLYRQMKKISRVKMALSASGKKLELLNTEMRMANIQLQAFNEDLVETSRVKEEYIAQFFNLCSAYIDKLEGYRKMLNKKAVAKQFDEISRILKSTDFVDAELQELYRNFDLIFIHLYPGFVKQFNDMLLTHERHVLKQGEVLNTELRIFALERLGVTDSVRIAAFLRCSISTVYNYRTKARNRSAVSREEFDSRIGKIGLVSEQ